MVGMNGMNGMDGMDGIKTDIFLMFGCKQDTYFSPIHLS